MLDRNVVCAECLITYDANKHHECTRCGSTERCSLNYVAPNNGWELGKGQEPTFDPVETVKHYQVFPEHDIEARHIIARCINLSGLKGDQAYHYGNALKYLLRLNRKGDMEEDASKAQEYLDYMKGK